MFQVLSGRSDIDAGTRKKKEKILVEVFLFYTFTSTQLGY
jgi:hypothetical protein